MGVGMKTAWRKAAGAILPGKSRPAKDRAFYAAQAREVTRVLGQMKGAAMKLGQLLSTDPDMVPPGFADALVGLQKQAPPMTWLTVRRQVEENFDRPIEAVFSWFDPEPIGAASIGQVHRGRLLSGEEVAVKIQYPGITASLDSDLKNVKTAMTLAKVLYESSRIDEYFGEIRDALEQECDYRIEAANLAEYAQVLASRERVRVPRPHPAWTTREVLTMEYLEGVKIDEHLAAMPTGAERTELCERFVATHSWMLHDRYQIHCDPHPGNFLVQADGTLVFLDFGCVKSCDARFADGILDILDACWQHDDERAAAVYRELGFGASDAPASLFDPKTLRQYHEIVLEPLITDCDFEFARWEMRRRLQSFVMSNPVFLRWVPPAEGLQIFRVMGGIKGLMVKSDAKLNVYRMAVETARRAGRLTGPPKPR